MKKMYTHIMTAILSVIAWASSFVSEAKPVTGRFVGRRRTIDIAYLYRMGAGFQGDVNRTHPASIEPVLIDTTAPPTSYGQAVLVNPANNGVRPFTVGDHLLTDAYGITVRPYPTQQASAQNFGAATLGAAVPPVAGILDVLKDGYIMVKLPVGAACAKGGQVFVWCAASAGVHVQGGFEAVAGGGVTTAALLNAKFNGVPDASGVVEVVISPARN